MGHTLPVLSCPVIREEEVPVGILKQALSSPGTHHITALPQLSTDPRPSELVLTVAHIHSLSRWNELLWFWREAGGGRWWCTEEGQVTSHIPMLPQLGYVGHTLLWLIKNSGWRYLLNSQRLDKCFMTKNFLNLRCFAKHNYVNLCSLSSVLVGSLLLTQEMTTFFKLCSSV